MNPVAGWYTDPTEPDAVRYWDGDAWTKHTAPVSAPPPPASAAASTSGYGQPTGSAAPAFSPQYGQQEPTYVPMHTQQMYRPQPHYVVAVESKNSKATRALVWGLISLIINPFGLPSILAIVFGAQGRRIADDMERAGLPNSGRGRATSALVVGIVGAALFVVWVVYYLNRS